MADISVSLALNDKAYSDGIKKATVETKNFNTAVKESSSSGLTSLSKLQGSVTTLTSKFSLLGNAVAAVGFASLIRGALTGADKINDLSSALGVSVSKLKELEFAASGANGNLDSMANMLSKLENNVQSAVEGNQKLRDSLREVGIGYDQIKNLSPDEQFKRISVALAGMTDQTKKVAIATDIFGKSAAQFDFSGFSSEIDSVSGKFDDYAERAKELDRINRQMEVFIVRVKDAFAEMISPILGLISPMDSVAGSMNGARIAAGALVGALAIFAVGSIISGITKIVSALGALAGLFLSTSVVTGISTAALSANTLATLANVNSHAFLSGAVGRLGTATAAASAAQALFTGLQESGVASATQLARAEAALTLAKVRLAAATTAASETQAVLTGVQVGGVAASAAAGAGVTSLTSKFAGLGQAVAAASGVLALFYSSDLNKGEEEFLEKQRKQALALAEAVKNLSAEERERYNKLNAYQKSAVADQLIQQDLQKQAAKRLEAINGPATGAYASTTDEITAAIKQQNLEIIRTAELSTTVSDSLFDQLTKYKEMNAEKIKDIRYSANMLTMTEAQKTLHENHMASYKSYQQERQALEEKYYQYSISSKAEEIAQLPQIRKAIAELTEEYKKQIPVIDELTAAYIKAQEAKQLDLFKIREQIKVTDELTKMQDDMAKLTMTEIEQKYYDIDAAAKASAKSAIEAEEARRGSALSKEEAAEYYRVASAGSDRLKQKTKELYDQSRSFSTGWKKAFNEYKDNATNAAKQAGEIFAKATSGMEDMIVNFAKTGKFEWKSFVADMLEQLLRMQIQQVFAQMLGGMQNSMAGVTGSAAGASGGGNIMGDLVGAIGGMIGGNGGRTPPIVAQPKSNSGGVLSGIGDLLSGAWGGISDFFGGFFANGGNLGAGKWGIAGENGPEIIQGPANIIPNSKLGGSVTNVTYNIQANDALSFKQMLARDPAFIHSVAEYGRQSLPQTRR